MTIILNLKNIDTLRWQILRYYKERMLYSVYLRNLLVSLDMTLVMILLFSHHTIDFKTP